MSDRLKILVVDDEPFIRDFLTTIIASEFSAEFMEADSGNMAIEILGQNKFDLVICDFNMPNGNGQAVFNRVQALDPIPNYILITSDDEIEHPNIIGQPRCGYLQKPFEFNTLIKSVSATLNIVPVDHSKEEFVALPISTINKNDILPFDLYLKLGANHQVKYFNAHKQLTLPEKERIKNLKTKEVFVRIEEFQKFILVKQRVVFQSLVLPINGVDHNFEMSSANGEFAQIGLKKLLDDKEMAELTQKNLKTVFALSFKVKAFNGLMDWAKNSDLTPKKLHAVMLTFFCNIILKNSKSLIYDFKTYLNLGYVAVLHDMNLDDYIVKNEFRILNGINIKSQINKTEQDILIAHVGKLLPIISSWPHCPPEVIEVIAQHHERADGTGFPLGLKGDKVSELSGIFNVAHDVAALIWDHKTGSDLQKHIEKLAEVYKGYKYYEEPLAILVREVLMK